MGKDPAVLWYWADWNSGTTLLSRHLKGCYMDLLHAQFNNGRLSLEEIRTVLGSDFGSAWPTLQKKFAVDETGKYFNEKAELEKNKRVRFTDSRKNNLKKSHMGSHMNPHMENENRNVNGVEKVKDGGAGETIRGEVSYSAVETVEKNAIKFEHLCMKYSKTAEQGKELLTDYHLWMQKNEKYPKTKQALFAGFESWIRNDKKINSNGTKTNRQSSASSNGKPGTSEARVNTAKDW